MKKTVLLSIALITAGFITATAQNDISIPKKYQGENTGFEYPNFETPNLPAIKKAKTGQVWWEPDTVYATFPYGDEYEYSVIYRLLNKYNSHGLLKERIQQRWMNNSWVNYSSDSYTYTYDSNDNVLTCSGPNLTTYTYDSNNNILTQQIQIRENDSWVNYMSHTFTYDSNNNILTYLRQLWQNNSWKNNHFYTCTYDSNNNLLTRLEQGVWINNSWDDNYSLIYTYTYDSNNNRLTELRQTRFNNSLINSWFYTYTYDSNNNRLTEELVQDWVNNSWKNSELITYTYDSNNNVPTQKLVQDWENDSWVNGEQYLRTYDENGNGTSIETWLWMGESWQPIGDISTETILYYNNMQSNFRWGCHKLTASYINVADLTAIKEPPATPDLNAISIYPNPTRGELQITNYELRVEDIQVFDISGVNVLNTQQTAIDISYLPTGIYFVQIKTEKGVVTKKVVKL